MNAHDIELPAEFRSSNSIPVTQATIKSERMAEILRAAIELDRQGRGEPVGWRDFIENIATPRSEPLNSVSGYSDKASRKAAMGVLRMKAADLLDEGPQPADPTIKESLTVAEPVKAPSDEDIISIMSDYAMAHETEAGIARYTKFDIVDGVRALLKRIQPASEDARDAARYRRIINMTRKERQDVLYFADDRDVINAIDAAMQQERQP